VELAKQALAVVVLGAGGGSLGLELLTMQEHLVQVVQVAAET